jgi:hypothetical protein
MAYTFSLLAPTPAWISINPSTGVVVTNPAAMPPAGHVGLMRIQCTDGVTTAITIVPINLQAAYAVAVDYRETVSTTWQLTLRSGTRVRLPGTPSTNTWKTQIAGSTRVTTLTPAVPAANDWRTQFTSGSADAPSTGGGGGS